MDPRKQQPGGEATALPSMRPARTRQSALGKPSALPQAAFRDGMRIAAGVLLAGLFGLQLLALWRAPAMWQAAEILVQPSAQPLVLGRHELAAPHAERRQFALRKDGRQGWMLRNLSSSVPVTLIRHEGELRSGSALPGAGKQMRIGAALFTINHATDESLSFSGAGHHWHYDGATLSRDGAAQPPCADAGLAARAQGWWNRLMPLSLSAARPLSFGGNVHCGNRLGLSGEEAGAALLYRDHGRLRLAAGAEGAHTALQLASGRADSSSDIRQQEYALDGVEALAVGGTRFHVAARGDSLVLQPGRKVALHGAPEIQLPPGVEWQWRQRALWAAPQSPALWFGLAIALSALLLAKMLASATLPHLHLACARQTVARPALRAETGQPWRTLLLALAAAALLASGIASIVAQRMGQAPGAAYALLLAGGACALWLSMPGRLPLAVAAGLTLAATGLLARLELGLAAGDSSWLRYYLKTAALLAAGSGAIQLFRLWAGRRHAAPALFSMRGIECLLALFAALALLALAAQVLWGDETGVFDMQPVELAKLALAALSAHCLALRMGWHSAAGDGAALRLRWLQLIAPVLLFLALLGLALVQVDDYSPLILLLIWSMGLALTYACAARKRWLAALLLCLAATGVGGIVLLRQAGPEELAHLPVLHAFYADRFQVWLDPARHPHTGQQMLLGAQAIAEGGWRGSDGWFGLSTLGKAAPGALAIPAVQDDFAPSFFLNRHGLASALALWLAQAALVGGLLLTAWRCHATGSAARDFRHAWRARFRSFALCGGAAFVLGHLLLSWGTNLAIFPIMGQPMSFLSAGGSHLLFFLLPLLALDALSTASFEE
ncbi:FtsW/RodA/SpoVE family cell cycle protein [Massilia sp. BJB1822]|uniref:FtsW/RodA/SpoVE family cell cycle protein n=1 Tax=Massilia sp. BJB1822 TaxID=2744470 RepID=UPI001E2866F0|nr:FtsW/RodA/SpoVE family cell cycle protein [Massilia sp. BJB1822]